MLMATACVTLVRMTVDLVMSMSCHEDLSYKQVLLHRVLMLFHFGTLFSQSLPFVT